MGWAKSRDMCLIYIITNGRRWPRGSCGSTAEVEASCQDGGQPSRPLGGVGLNHFLSIGQIYGSVEGLKESKAPLRQKLWRRFLTRCDADAVKTHTHTFLAAPSTSCHGYLRLASPCPVHPQTASTLNRASTGRQESRWFGHVLGLPAPRVRGRRGERQPTDETRQGREKGDGTTLLYAASHGTLARDKNINSSPLGSGVAGTRGGGPDAGAVECPDYGDGVMPRYYLSPTHSLDSPAIVPERWMPCSSRHRSFSR